jgi:hypothetical protein
MAHRTIRVDEAFLREAEKEANANKRSLGAQVEYWARIGRGVVRNRSFSEDRIAQFLAGVIPIDHLSLQEKIASINEVQRMSSTAQSRERVATELRAERQNAALPSYTVDERYPEQLICRYPDGRIVAGHFESTGFIEDQELESDLSPKRIERRRHAAG